MQKDRCKTVGAGASPAPRVPPDSASKPAQPRAGTSPAPTSITHVAVSRRTLKRAAAFFVFFIAVLLPRAAVCQEQAPRGRWEGEVAFPTRPIVLLVDFDRQQGWLSITGSRAFPVSGLKAEAGELRFDLPLGGETVSVRAKNAAEGISGEAVVGDVRGGFVLRRLAELPPPRSREEAWRQDLDVLLTRFLPYDRSYSDAARAELRRRVEAIKASLPRTSDAELLVQTARAVALGGNAHTRLYLVRNRTEVRRLPLRVWHFRDGFRVVRASAEYRELLGCRVEKTGAMKIDEAARMVSGIKPGNASWQRYMSAYTLTSPELLVGSRVAADAESIPFEFRCAGRAVRRAVAPLPLRKVSAPTESWWDLAPSAKRNESTPLSALPADKAPLYLRRPDVHYWFERLPERGLLYFQYNRSMEMPGGPSLSDFGRQLLAEAGREDVRALVVDLRFNTGGNLNLATPLMQGLQEKMKGKPVFVVTGRATFSAGISHVAQWKQWGAKIVGEEVGDELDMWAEGGNVELPNSKLTVHYSNGFHGYSRREYPERQPFFLDLGVETLKPDFPVETTWAEYADGRDPAMELIAKVLSGRVG